jgi:hypothetical protein
MMNISLHTLPYCEQYNFLILLINLLIVVNTYTKESFPIYVRYLQIAIKHINNENKARELLESPIPEDVHNGKIAQWKCAQMFKAHISLYQDIIADIEGIKEKYVITEAHFISYHGRYMIDNERVAADLLNLL